MLENGLYLNSQENIGVLNGKLTIVDSEFVSQEKIDEVMAVVNSLNLVQMNDKLVNFYGWSKEDTSLMHNYYNKWLVLHACYPELAIAPSAKLDEYWHMHILDTRKYMEDCQLVFGEYLHHYPYFGLENDSENLDSGFELTKTLFLKHFGHELTGLANPCAATRCR